MSLLSASATESQPPSAASPSYPGVIGGSSLDLDQDQDYPFPTPSSGPNAVPPAALNMVIRQDPFSMTLDANALLAGSLFLLAGMHFVPRALLESSILAAPVLLLIHNDYQNFLRLGPGGTPPTVAGYASLAWYRLFALRDTLSPPPFSVATSRPSRGILPAQDLPYRPGPRPTVVGLAPQRQLDQYGPHASLVTLRRTLARLAANHPDRFGVATSCLERHGLALFARHPVNVCGNGEVFHIHSSDRSMHMNLHPEDIGEILRKGWGERHPLAWGRSSPHRAKQQQPEGKAQGWFPALRINSPLPETFVMTYSPRGKRVSSSAV